MKLQHPERLKRLQKFLKSPMCFREIPQKGIMGEKVPKIDLNKEYADERYAVLIGREEDKLGTYDLIVFCYEWQEVENVIEYDPFASVQVFDMERDKVVFILAEDRRPQIWRE